MRRTFSVFLLFFFAMPAHSSGMPAHEHLSLCRAVFGEYASFGWNERVLDGAISALRTAGRTHTPLVCYIPLPDGPLASQAVVRGGRKLFLVGIAHRYADRAPLDVLRAALQHEVAHLSVGENGLCNDLARRGEDRLYLACEHAVDKEAARFIGKEELILMHRFTIDFLSEELGRNARSTKDEMVEHLERRIKLLEE